MGTITFEGAIVSNLIVIFSASTVILAALAFYLLRSVGLFVLAKKNGVKLAGLAFIPGVWMFTACKIIGKARIFGMTMEKMAVWFAIVFSISVYLSLLSNFITYFPYIGYYLAGGEIGFISQEGTMYLETGANFVNPFDTQFVSVFLRVIGIFSYLLNIAELFITITVYISLFRKFWPEHYILAAVLSFLGLFPIFVFVIRNKQPVDYMEYIRRRFANSGYNPYGNYGGQGGYGANGGYGGQNNYGGNDGQSNYGAGNGGGEPFGEFSDRPDEPFGEFSGENKGNDKDDNV